MKRKRIIGISSGGGHLAELIKAIPDYYEKDIIYVTLRNGHTQSTLKNKKRYFIIDPHVSKIKYMINFIQSFFLFIKIRPKVIISSGAGIAIPLNIIGSIFNSKIIFIESGARIYNPSKTGVFLYKHADLFIIQYKSLHTYFPKAKIGSL
jgi:beta-1,4-N-acetylglucosaminyltransferase